MTRDLLYLFARLAEAEAREAGLDAEIAYIFENDRKRSKLASEEARHLRALARAARARAKKDGKARTTG